MNPLPHGLNGYYDWIAKVGEGRFGTVHCVQKKIKTQSKGSNHSVWNVEKSALSSTNTLASPSSGCCALKCYKDDWIEKRGVDELAVMEIATLRYLANCPQIVQIQSVICTHSMPQSHNMNMVAVATQMEFVETNLDDWIRTWFHTNGLHSEIQHKLQIAHELTQAVEYVHSRGICHLDIKPANILISESNNSELHVKLADFGSCERLNASKPTTKERVTWTHRSPELQLHLPDYTSAADIWSLGVVLFQLFFGINPFHRGEAETQLYSSIIRVVGSADTSTTEIVHNLNSLLLKSATKSRKTSKKSKSQRVIISHTPDSRSSDEDDNDTEFEFEFLDIDLNSGDAHSSSSPFPKLYGKELFERILQLIAQCVRYDPRQRITASQARILVCELTNRPSVEHLPEQHKSDDSHSTDSTDCKFDDFLFESKLDFVASQWSLFLPALKAHAYRLFRRYRESAFTNPNIMSSNLNECGVQAACISLAGKMLSEPNLEDLREAVVRCSSFRNWHEFNMAEIEVAQSLDWYLE